MDDDVAANANQSLRVILKRNYGLDSIRRDNVAFVDHETVAFSVGNLVQFLRVKNTTAKEEGEENFFMRSHRLRDIGAIAVHPERTFLALCEGEMGFVTEKKEEEEGEGKGEGECARVDVYAYPSLELKKSLRGGAKSKYALAKFSPDGTMLATVSSTPDYLLTIWDWENESSILRCKAFSQEVFGLSFSPNVYGQLTTWGTGHVRFWKMADTFTGLKLHGSLGKFGAEPLSDICATCESDDGKITLSGTTSGAILAWSGGLIETKFCIDEEITCHDGAINSMHLRRIIVQHNQQEQQEQKKRLQLVTTGEDGYVRAWDVDEILSIVQTPEIPFLQKIKPIFGYHLGDNVNCKNAIVSDDNSNSKLVVQNACGSLLELDLSDGTSQEIFEAHSGAIAGCDVSFVSPHFFTTGDDRTVRCYDYSQCKLLFTSRFQARGTILKVFPKAVDTSSRLVLVGFSDGVVRVLLRSEASFIVLESLKPHTDAIVSIDWNVEGSKFATASKDKTIFLFDVEAKGKLAPIGFVRLDKVPKHIEYNKSKSTDDKNAIDVYFQKKGDGVVRLLSTKLPKNITDTFELEACIVSNVENTSIEEVSCSQTSHSGRFLVQGYMNGSILLSVLNQNRSEEKRNEEEAATVANKEVWIEKKAHVSKITGVAITYEDQYLVSVSEDGSLLLFELKSKFGSFEVPEVLDENYLDYGKPIPEDIEIDEFPSLEQAKRLSRESQISSDAEKTRKRTLEKLNLLRKDFKSLVRANNKLGSVDRLPESAFEVDSDLLGITEKKTGVDIERAEREMAWRLERAEIILERLEKRYRDDIEANCEELHARLDSNIDVEARSQCTFSCESFSLKKEDCGEEIEDEDQDFHERGKLPPGDASIISDETSTITSNVEAPRVSEIYEENNREKSDLTSQEIRRIERKKRSEEMAAFELTRPIDASETNIEEDLEIIEARNCISDFPLKSDPLATIVKEKRANVELKDDALTRVNAKIREIKIAFNAEFQALKDESATLGNDNYNCKLRKLCLSKATAAQKCKSLELQRFILERELEIIQKKHDAGDIASDKKLYAAEENVRAKKAMVKKYSNRYKERETISIHADNALQNLMKVYENSLPPGAPRAKLFKVFMRDIESEIEEKCPTGCEEEVYERVLQLRSKRRELEGAKVEAMKESEKAKTFLEEKVKETEVAVAALKDTTVEKEAFEKKKQADLNEIEIYVTLKAHEILHFDADSTDTVSTVKLGSAENGLVFANSAIEKLKLEIEHLNGEISSLKKSQQELKKQFAALEIERKEEEVKERDLEAKEIDVQMRKFGQIVDLDALDAMAREERGGEELKIKLRAQETYHAKEAAEWRKAIQQSNDEYTALIEQHTSLLQKIAASKRALLTQKRGGVVTSNSN
jgi:WD40 repeat protein